MADRRGASAGDANSSALLFIDLDRFKLVNDSLGHAVGDELLVAVGARLEGGVREDDVVARIGGDEFVVLLRSIRGTGDAELLAAHLHAVLSTPFDVGGRTLYVTASIGIAIISGGRTADDILRAADLAMYRSKLAGKARTTDPIQLTSDHAGTGTVWAWTDTGSLAQASVEYHDAVPTQLLVRGLPSRAVNDGKTVVNVTVFLEDDTAATASADQDLSVKLTSSVGDPNPSDLTIPKGGFFGEAVLTSPTSGIAEITATAPRLKPGAAEVEFVFPLLLVTLAGTGGLIGSVARMGRQLFSGVWWWNLLGSVGLGIVLGLLFYLLALFGVIASIPKLAIPFAQLPTTNDLGALVLGFFGGYYARSWLPASSSNP